MRVQAQLHQSPGSTRLHYIDSLRVLATMGVFIFHAALVFSPMEILITNAEQSVAVVYVLFFLFPWGMPLFFLIAGMSTRLALQRRTAGEFVRERTGRLLVPFLVGSALLSPFQHYLVWSHEVRTGVVDGSFLESVANLPWGPTTRIFGAVGVHLWFLGFLLLYSLLTWPLFRWLAGEVGQRFVQRLVQWCERRGGILVIILPLLLVRLSLHPFFPYEHDWADFAFLMCYFVLGYLLSADMRLAQAVRRDWLIMLAAGVIAFLAFAVITVSTGQIDIEAPPARPLDFVWWGLITVCSWCFSAFMLSVGMRFLNYRSGWLSYGKAACLPFFVVHLPVIQLTAYYVVQWNVGLWPKLLTVAFGSFAVSLGLYELLIKRVGILRAAFGVKTAP